MTKIVVVVQHPMPRVRFRDADRSASRPRRQVAAGGRRPPRGPDENGGGTPLLFVV